jgi:hypothetical protein
MTLKSKLRVVGILYFTNKGLVLDVLTTLEKVIRKISKK